MCPGVATFLSADNKILLCLFSAITVYNIAVIASSNKMYNVLFFILHVVNTNSAIFQLYHGENKLIFDGTSNTDSLWCLFQTIFITVVYYL
jgi:hypothetical protein